MFFVLLNFVWLWVKHYFSIKSKRKNKMHSWTNKKARYDHMIIKDTILHHVKIAWDYNVFFCVYCTMMYIVQATMMIYMVQWLSTLYNNVHCTMNNVHGTMVYTVQWCTWYNDDHGTMMYIVQWLHGTMMYMVQWCTWYNDVRTMYMVQWWPWYNDVHCTIMYMVQWCTWYNDVHGTMMTMVQWWPWYNDLHCTIMYIVQWCTYMVQWWPWYNDDHCTMIYIVQ